jgi:4-amino-4-deoxy-L-arabinose transferase-like glycosyltransferase
LTPDRRTILALFSLAVGLRILYAVVVGTRPDINPNPYSHDFLVARQIASGDDWWSHPVSPSAPLYQFFLAGVLLIGGIRIWPAIIVQAILGGIIAFLIYRTGERKMGRGVGLLASLWFALYVHNMHYSSILVRDVLVALLLLAVCYVLIRFASRMRGALWAGLFYSALVHTDPQFIWFLPAIVLYLLLFATKHRLLNIHSAFLFLATTVVLFVPWTLRNYKVYRDPMPIGLEAARYFNAPVPTARASESTAAAAKVPPIWHNSVELWRAARLRAVPGEDPPWSVRHNLISLAQYGLLIPFFLLGIYLSFRKRNAAGLVMTVAIGGYYLIRALYGGSERARGLIEPMLILLAFYGIVNLIAYIRARRAVGPAT